MVAQRGCLRQSSCHPRYSLREGDSVVAPETRAGNVMEHPQSLSFNTTFTLHPGGIPHGSHPGTVEASIGKEGTEELAVMADTFHPLNVTREASRLEDEGYPYSWVPPDDSEEHARELSERGPEAFPD